MWVVIKTIFFGLVDLFVLAVLIKWLFNTPMEFLKAFWQVGKPLYRVRRTDDDMTYNLNVYKIGFTFIVVGLLMWGEKSLFY